MFEWTLKGKRTHDKLTIEQNERKFENRHLRFLIFKKNFKKCSMFKPNLKTVFFMIYKVGTKLMLTKQN